MSQLKLFCLTLFNRRGNKRSHPLLKYIFRQKSPHLYLRYLIVGCILFYLTETANCCEIFEYSLVKYYLGLLSYLKKNQLYCEIKKLKQYSMSYCTKGMCNNHKSKISYPYFIYCNLRNVLQILDISNQYLCLDQTVYKFEISG